MNPALIGWAIGSAAALLLIGAERVACKLGDRRGRRRAADDEGDTR